MFNLLKILKWARQQGYKDAEQKYFHALRAKALSPLDRESLLHEMHGKAVDDYRSEQLVEELKVSDRLIEIINSVFEPEEKVQHKIIERKSRFLP